MNYRPCLLALPLLLLSGCNSSSATKPTTPTKPNVRPLPDYQFTDSNRQSLLEERQEILDSMRVTYAGETFDGMIFAESYGEGTTLIKLENAKGDEIDLLLRPESSDAQCLLRHSPQPFTMFKCDKSVRSKGNDTTLISSQSVDGKNISVEYYHEAEEHMASIGSTLLSPIKSENRVTFTTSFAFDGFFKEIYGQQYQSESVLEESDERVHSTLGVSTYYQLEQLTKEYHGTSMTLQFNNHIGGSADDDINMHTGLLIHQHKMDTEITQQGSVFSGGTDLFAAGQARILHRASNSPIEKNQQIGVHSWGQGDKTAKDFPFTDLSHRKQATFFNTIMGDKGIDFYLFTLDSAPATGAYWMTKADSDKYQFITDIR